MVMAVSLKSGVLLMQPVGKWRLEEPVQEAPVAPVGKWRVETPRDEDTITFESEMMFDEAVAQEERFLAGGGKEPEADQAMFWAERYNADVSIPLEERVRMFNDKQSVEVLPETSAAIKAALASGAFDVEMNSRGLSEDVVVASLENISKVETNGGKNNTISSGMAGGILQVIPSTFKDLLSRGVVGPKALKAIGKSKEELLSFSKQESAEYLRDNDNAAAIFGLAAFLNKVER